jgi:hypothetical protein
MQSKYTVQVFSNLLGWMKLGNEWIQTICRQWKRRRNVEGMSATLVVVLWTDVTLIDEIDQRTDVVVPDRVPDRENAGDTVPSHDLRNVDRTVVNIVLYRMGFIYRLLWISANSVVARAILINRPCRWTEFDIN